MKSPIIQTFKGPNLSVLRVCYTTMEVEVPSPSPFEIAKAFSGEAKPLVAVGPGNRLGTRIDQIKPDDLNFITVKNIEEAEDRLFNRPGALEYRIDPRDILQAANKAPPQYVGDTMASPAVLVNRQCNLIAARTRRGAGNRALMNQRTWETFFSTSVSYAEYSKAEQITVGRWLLKGKLNNCIEVYIGDALADGVIVTAWVGSLTEVMDGPAGLVTQGKTHRLYMMPNNTTSLGNCDDYFSTIKLTLKEIPIQVTPVVQPKKSILNRLTGWLSMLFRR